LSARVRLLDAGRTDKTDPHDALIAGDLFGLPFVLAANAPRGLSRRICRCTPP